MVNLSKGQKVSLQKNTNLCLVGLGWDPNKYVGQAPFDLDASVFLLDASGKVASDEDFVFYGNPTHSSGSVRSHGDDRTGGNSDGGDDEQITINLTRIPAHVQKLAIVVTIDEAAARRQNFGQVSHAYVRVSKLKNEGDAEGDEVVRYDLDEEFSSETAVVACEIVRNGGEWSFSAMGLGLFTDLAGVCRKYGVNV